MSNEIHNNPHLNPYLSNEYPEEQKQVDNSTSDARLEELSRFLNQENLAGLLHNQTRNYIKESEFLIYWLPFFCSKDVNFPEYNIPTDQINYAQWVKLSGGVGRWMNIVSDDDPNHVIVSIPPMTFTNENIDMSYISRASGIGVFSKIKEITDRYAGFANAWHDRSKQILEAIGELAIDYAIDTEDPTLDYNARVWALIFNYYRCKFLPDGTIIMPPEITIYKRYDGLDYYQVESIQEMMAKEGQGVNNKEPEEVFDDSQDLDFS